MTSANLDASFCNTISLHNTSAIQPHGALIVVNVTDFQIIQISANVCEWTGRIDGAILNRSLECLLDQQSLESLRKKRENSLLKNVTPLYLTFTFNKKPEPYLTRVHEKEHYLLIEIEFINRVSGESNPFFNSYQQLQEATLSINQSSTISDLASIACREIKRISGFDKVMIYTFDEKWNGLVLGEAMEEEMESYLGLKFPASDVPKQARDLNLKNSYRVIPDRQYKKVSLIPQLNPLTNGPTDLSDVKSRSVVDVHLEYLANMNVQASMSTRIIHNESLWGLITCHHRQAKLPTFQECTVFELLSNVISSKLSSLVNQSRTDERIRLNNLINSLSSKMFQSDRMINAFRKNGTEIAKLLGGDGIAICWDGKISSEGITPAKNYIRDLLPWLQEKHFKVVVDINSLPDTFEPAKNYSEVASGILILPIQPYEGNFILAFKMEAVKTVSWGGNPDDVVTFEPNSTKYHPRNSFAIWKETVRNTSNPWTDEELIAAERFRNIVVEHTLKKLTATLEEKVKERTSELALSNEKLSLALEELQELTHVTSHDLQEPVRKIHLFATELNKPIESSKRAEYIEKIMKASKRISSLITDLVNISKIRGERVFQKIELNTVLDGILKKLEGVILEANAIITISDLPPIEAVPEQMDQLFTHVVGNAIKFRRPFVQCRIEIRADWVNTPRLDADEDEFGKYVRISISDNGIGFDEKHADKLFKVFETLHPDEYEGTGSSLAVAKRIVEYHGGVIFARGGVNQGATFTFILPVSR
jgi:light-regulated signal transduction histidine kinase (bacteriophytochrome)